MSPEIVIYESWEIVGAVIMVPELIFIETSNYYPDHSFSVVSLECANSSAQSSGKKKSKTSNTSGKTFK